MKKRYALDIRGKRKEWSFVIMAEPKHVEDWRADGLHVDEVVNIIPQWWVDLGLPVKLWCAVQDFFWKGDEG
ncbi:MAG TPA: hypothetical protein VN364_08210 [Bellilinea sp.]|nr:hypothetical protein [Bellilinea sp.]